MALIKQTPKRKITIDLAGPQGNAYFLLATAMQIAKQIGADAAAIEKEMQSADYKHLVLTFDKHFGAYVDLIVPETLDLNTPTGVTAGN